MTQNQNVRYNGTPPILIFADTAEGDAESRAVVETALGREAQSAPIDRAVSRIDDTISIGAVIVDVRQDAGEPLDRLLDRLDLAARHNRHASVVCLAPHLIDVAIARAAHRDVTLLVGPSPIERSAAISLAAHSARALSPMLGEERGALDQLLQLSEEVGRIARTLAALSSAPDQRSTTGSTADRHGAFEPPSAAAVRAAIRARRLREQFFAGDLFADPAWDMLLDLLAARLEGRPVAVSSLCIAAAVPPTTALRWMKQLTDDGLFVRVADPRDGRRVFIELSDAAAAGLSAYFSALGRMGVGFP